MGWQNIGEGIIASIIGTLITNLIFQNKKSGFGGKIRLHFPKDPFLISLSITVFFGILSLFGFYYEWEKFSYLVVITFVLGFITTYIYNTQCPKCKKIFVRKRIHTELLKKWVEKFPYRNSKNYYYSDGTFKNNKEYGSWKTRPERMEKRKDYFVCKACNHEWDSEPYTINLDKHKRPKPEKVKTTIQNPEEIYFD